MSQSVDGAALSSQLVTSHEDTLSQVSVKAVGSQIALMSGISVSFMKLRRMRGPMLQIATVIAFSFFRPREKKVSLILSCGTEG